MTNTTALADLLEDFPELLGGDVDLQKEIYAHFGLLFSGFGLLEAGLQNCYIMWALELELKAGVIEDPSAWESAHERVEEKAFGATFGGLIRLLQECGDIEEIRLKLETLRKGRNYFAHHFFRDEIGHMFDDASRLNLICRMDVFRRKVRAVEVEVGKANHQQIQRIHPNMDVETKIDDIAEGERREILENGRRFFGWED